MERERESLKAAILNAVGRLEGGQMGMKITEKALREEFKAIGVLDKDDRGNLLASERKRFHRARLALFDDGALNARNDSIWRVVQ